MEDEKDPYGKPKPLTWEEIINDKRDIPHIPADPFSQLVVLVKPGATSEKLNAWVKETFEGQQVFLISACGNCDNSLFLLGGEGIKILIQGSSTTRTTPGGSTSPTAGGSSSSSPVDACPNYGARFPRPVLRDASDLQWQEEFNAPASSGENTPIDVAVLDTGLIPGLVQNNYLYESGDTPCIINAEKGWNFVGDNQDLNDDNPGKHGTTVSGFIIEQAAMYGNNLVRILPVKVHNRDGESDLYDVLCALAYSVKRGVKIINASFGFYFPRQCGLEAKQNDFERVLLLDKFISNYITKDVILAAAAGNQDNCYFDPYFRDLDNISFYPASFARNYKNIIAVTTVDEDEVAPDQNYSPNVVDVGVYADAANFGFKHPFNSERSVRGTSFAAPIIAGKIAGNYTFIKNKLDGENKSFNKKNILKIIAEKNNNLRSKIKNGRAVLKNKRVS